MKGSFTKTDSFFPPFISLNYIFENIKLLLSCFDKISQNSFIVNSGNMN